MCVCVCLYACVNVQISKNKDDFIIVEYYANVKHFSFMLNHQQGNVNVMLYLLNYI